MPGDPSLRDGVAYGGSQRVLARTGARRDDRIYPHLGETLRKLEQDHPMIAYLVGELEAATGRSAPPAELDRHLEGIAAIMESHFRYDERELLTVLEALALDVVPKDALGPL